MQRKLVISLAAMRLSVAVFFLVWAVEKIVAPELAVRVAETFYGFTPSTELLIAVGLAQVVLIGAFMLGLFKTVTYGGLLIIHALSVLSTWERLITPYTPPNHLFWAGVPIIALLLALFLLRNDDTALTLTAKSTNRK